MPSLLPRRLLLALSLVLVPLPAAKPTIWFLNVTDEWQVTTPSRLMTAGELVK